MVPSLARSRCLRWAGSRLFAAALLVLWLWAGLAAGAAAHPSPGSLGLLDLTVDGLHLEQDVPLSELQLALKQRWWAPGEPFDRVRALVAAHRDELKRYALAHVEVHSADTALPWPVTVASVRGELDHEGPRVRFLFEARAPEAEASRDVVLRDDLVVHEVKSHYARYYLRSDWFSGKFDGTPTLLGALRVGRTQLQVTRGSRDFAAGLLSMVRLGMDHILAGTDHLVFLFTLLLTAPLVVVGGRFRPDLHPRRTALSVAGTISAFTVGHSLTLAFSALGALRLPETLIEGAVALSILLSALHALRPIFPCREGWLALAFGCIHGTAFAGALVQRDLGAAQRVWTLLGFNLGIEIAQLGLLLLVLPWLLLLAGTRYYSAFRFGSATVAAVLSLGWLNERWLAGVNPTQGLARWLEHMALPLLCVLAVLSIFARALQLRAAARPP